MSAAGAGRSRWGFSARELAPAGAAGRVREAVGGGGPEAERKRRGHGRSLQSVRRTASLPATITSLPASSPRPPRDFCTILVRVGRVEHALLCDVGDPECSVSSSCPSYNVLVLTLSQEAHQDHRYDSPRLRLARSSFFAQSLPPMACQSARSSASPTPSLLSPSMQSRPTPRAS